MRRIWLVLPLLSAAAFSCVTTPAPPPAPTGTSKEGTETLSKLDGLLTAAWTTSDTTVGEEVDDATFLRRVTLDLLGRIPTVGELDAFANDGAKDKRSQLVDKLLDHPEHAKHLARAWDRILLGPEVKNRLVDRGALRRWLERRFQSDAAWDETARQLVSASGKTSVGGAYSGAALDENEDRGAEEQQAGINGAANFPLRFAKSPADMAGQTSKVFLGVQIQCAQCHDHKTEKWTQDDFRKMAASFVRTRITPMGREKGQMVAFEVESIDKPARRMLKNEDTRKIASFEPHALDGTALNADDPRQSLAAWMTSPDNPWFSRAMVNRVWAELVGAGFVDPVDDLRPSNPAILPEVLDALAEDFESNHFDLDWLYATIIASKAYSRAPTGTADIRAASFSQGALRPLSSDALLDSILKATDVETRIEELAPNRVELLKTQIRKRMGFVFEEDAESNSEGYEGTLQQALFSMNGALPVAATSYVEHSLLETLLERDDDDAAILELYRRTLGRAPTSEELNRAKLYVTAGAPASSDDGAERKARKKRGDKGGKKGAKKEGKVASALLARAVRSEADTARERAYEDLFWALVNSSEFSFRR